MPTRAPPFALTLALALAALGCTEFDVAGATTGAESGPRCADGAMDGDETDVDCGGACSKCDVGGRCLAAADCATGLCESGRCVAPTCADGTKNGGESDVDCGGPCDPCADGDGCLAATDCASQVCSPLGACAPSSCSDGELDGDESDVDCGGSCRACALGRACVREADCVAGTCASSRCEEVVGIWRKLTPAGDPPARREHALVFEPNLGNWILFGGAGSSGPLADTWRFDGNAWTEVMSSVPGDCTFPTVVYDPAVGAAVLSGGGDNHDTWTFDGSDWANVAGSGAPTDRDGLAAAYVAGKIAVFGGADGGGNHNDTLLYDGSSFSWSASSATGPSTRYGAAMESDPGGVRAILFGGTSNSVHALDDTWTWDGGSWNELHPVARPPARFGAAFAYDPTRARWVMFGGAGEGIAVDATDTWEFDGVTWQRTATSGPSARVWSRAASGHGAILLFGGQKSGGGELGDTWAYHAVGNACSDGNACDTGVCVDGLCCEAMCGPCEACNLPSSPGRCAKVLNGADPDSCAGTCDATGKCDE